MKGTQLWLELILAAGWTSGAVGLVATQEQGLRLRQLGTCNTAPRGVASTIAGEKTWVIDVPAARPGRIESPGNSLARDTVQKSTEFGMMRDKSHIRR